MNDMICSKERQNQIIHVNTLKDSVVVVCYCMRCISVSHNIRALIHSDDIQNTDLMGFFFRSTYGLNIATLSGILTQIHITLW